MLFGLGYLWNGQSGMACVGGRGVGGVGSGVGRWRDNPEEDQNKGKPF